MLVISKIYFLIIQGIIILLYLILPKKNTDENYFLFPSKLHFSLYLIGALILGYLINSDYQTYCIPVNWAKIILIFYVSYLICSWFLKKYLGEFLNQLILGTGLFIFIYLILFGAYEYLMWILINSIIIFPFYYFSQHLNKKYKTRFYDVINLFGLTLLLPYIIIYWTLWQTKKLSFNLKMTLFIIPLFALLTGIYLTFRINNIIERINKSEDKSYIVNDIIKDKTDKFLTEIILGAHWKYHTKICLYDGWRPPYHEPILGFAQPILYFSRDFHPEIKLKERIRLYKQVFPENDTVFNCKCAKYERLLN
jgi:hypothetical protein